MAYPQDVLDEVHSFLADKAGHRRTLVLDQKALAAEHGTQQIRFHRICHQLLEEGRLKQIGRGARGQKTVKVIDAEVLTTAVPSPSP